MNLTSSRSHAIFSITVRQDIPGESTGDVVIDNRRLTSKLHFVDLAGSGRTVVVAQLWKH